MKPARALRLPFLLVATLSACTGSGDASSADAGTSAMGDAGLQNTCAAPSGSGTTIDTSPTADVTWTPAASPYRLPSDLTIPEGVTVTLAPCTVVLLADGVSIDVSGKLVAAGIAGKPVTIEAADAAKPWTWIDATRTKVRPALDLSYAIVSGGGKVSGYPEQSAAIRTRGDLGGLPTPMIKVDHLEVRSSASVGISAFESSAFAEGSQSLTIKGSALEPIVTNILGLTTLPDGDLTGNGNDVIGITASERLGVRGQNVSATMHKRSVPYRIGTFGDTDAALWVTPQSKPDTSTLTIDPGTTIRFVSKQGLDVEGGDDDALGTIIARGTTAAPITLTSDAKAPQAGDYLGIRFRGVPTQAPRSITSSSNTRTLQTRPSPASRAERRAPPTPARSRARSRSRRTRGSRSRSSPTA